MATSMSHDHTPTAIVTLPIPNEGTMQFQRFLPRDYLVGRAVRRPHVHIGIRRSIYQYLRLLLVARDESANKAHKLNVIRPERVESQRRDACAL